MQLKKAELAAHLSILEELAAKLLERESMSGEEITAQYEAMLSLPEYGGLEAGQDQESGGSE